MATATIDVSDRVLTQDNEETIRWVPAPRRVTGNMQADAYAWAAASCAAPCSDDDLPEALPSESRPTHAQIRPEGQLVRLDGVDREPRVPRVAAEAPLQDEASAASTSAEQGRSWAVP